LVLGTSLLSRLHTRMLSCVLSCCDDSPWCAPRPLHLWLFPHTRFSSPRAEVVIGSRPVPSKLKRRVFVAISSLPLHKCPPISLRHTRLPAQCWRTDFGSPRCILLRNGKNYRFCQSACTPARRDHHTPLAPEPSSSNSGISVASSCSTEYRHEYRSQPLP
jgi:hypothetical protein